MRAEHPRPEVDDLPPASARESAAPVRRYLHDPSPWAHEHVVRSVSLCTAGVFASLLCWYQLSGRDTFRGQSGWVVASMAAGGLFGVGMSGWLLAGFREVRRGQRELAADVRMLFGLSSTPAAGPVADALVSGPGMTRAHRPSCRLVKGKSVAAVDAASREQAGLRRCGVCCT